MWSASIPYSTQVPGSSSRSRRSRTRSLPNECWRSTNFSPPMPRARSRRCARSPTSGPQLCTSPPPVEVMASLLHSAARALAALPLRAALLDARGDALGGILGLGVDREHRLEVVERVVDVHLEHAVERVATPPEHERRLGRERARELVH